MSDILLDVVHVGKRYTTYASNLQRFANWFGAGIKPSAEFWAVSDISFQVRRGESVALIGQNGAGKSSLLKLITGTVRPSTGSVAVAGSVSAILELGLGFNPEFTGRENAFHAGGLMGISQAELATLMPQIESFAEIGAFFDQPFRVYSSGMQARLAFALATARRPDLLIVDEVLSWATATSSTRASTASASSGTRAPRSSSCRTRWATCGRWPTASSSSTRARY
jgi:lipopolysaccharide transport system ATP-binding protein